MRKLLLFLLLPFFSPALFAQADTSHSNPDSINQRIFLIGDAGNMDGPTHPVIDWLKKNVNWDDEKNTVIFLGDNVYPLGLPLQGEPTYQHSKAILDDQISLVKGRKASSYFIPGNHDWRNGKLGGWEQVLNEVDYINSRDLKNVHAYPLYGCPGPVEVDLSDKVVVAFIDSQWFLYLHDKPGPGSTCGAKTIDEFSVELEEIAEAHPNQLVIIATHHALASYGPHGGDYNLRTHIFPLTEINPKLYIPLPVIGSIYPLGRGVFGSVQDIPHPLYKTMINTIEAVMMKHPNAVSVAGHDHGLQLIEKIKARDSLYYIVSGAGSELTRIKSGKSSLFADANLGFSVIEVWKSGKTNVKFYNLDSKDFNDPTYSKNLRTIPAPPPSVIDTTKIILDSIVYRAGDTSLKGNWLSKFLVGKNYRKEWITPLRLHVLDIGSEQGGLTPIKAGGGKETKTLRVKDSSGKEWTMRTIQKFPEAEIPPDLRQTALKHLVQEGVSAAYPFGALSMEPLSKAAGVPYLRNKLVYLPDDPRLSRFRADFKNTVALMEEREPTGVKKTDNTDDLFIKLEKDNDNHVDQKALLKARLLDMFVMDFDRYEGQWFWATRDTGKGKIYYAIPKDRDQVFFVNQGIIPKIARSPSLVPEIQGFQPKAENIKTFNRAARNFDRTFLTELSENDWRRQVDTFLNAMTNNVIEAALHRQPTEIRHFSAPKIITTLEKRRNYFADEMMEYYRFLSKMVTIVGTQQREQFFITKNEDGTVHVVENKIAKDSTISSKIYDRVFYPPVTREIRIFGLNGDDRFVVEGTSSPIKIRLIGGSGNDQFINNGIGKKVLAYDVSFEQNYFSGKTDFKKIVSANPENNRYERLNFKYNYYRAGLRLDYNVVDGLFIGPKMEYVTQGFRKEPYGMRHYVEATGAVKTGSLHFKYDADFNKALGNADILIRSDFKAPVNITNFFGLGNATVFDHSYSKEYYRARYNIINASAYVSYQLQSWMRINLGPTFQYFKLDSNLNKNRFVSNTALSGLDPAVLNVSKNYIGADARVAINSRNNNVVPTRGLVLDAGIRPLFGVNDHHFLAQANIDMRIFMSLSGLERLVLAMRFGWAKNYGTFQFPQAMYLGETDNLRGYRKQRFAGRSMLFNNTELRIRLANFNTYLFSGLLGVVLFNDIGRVYVNNEESKTWHDGYGGGIWISPVKRFVIVASVARSGEEKALPLVTLGFQF